MKGSFIGVLALATLGVNAGCAYTSFKNLSARSLVTPIEPASARIGTRFCFDRAAEYSRRERSHRSLSDGAFGISVAGFTAALGTGLVYGAVDHEGSERALKVVSLSSLVVGGMSLLTWGYLGYRANSGEDEAKLAATRGLHTLAVAERLDLAKHRFKEADEDAKKEVQEDATEDQSARADVEKWRAEVERLEGELAAAVDDCVDPEEMGAVEDTTDAPTDDKPTEAEDKPQ